MVVPSDLHHNTLFIFMQCAYLNTESQTHNIYKYVVYCFTAYKC